MSTTPGEQPDRTMRRPSRLLQLLFDAPSWLYQVGLGWLLGTRFLALTHRGRKSGRTRRTILEVVSFDRNTLESVVVSAYGSGADWYQNLRAEPALRIETGRWEYAPVQRFLKAKEAEEAAARFCLEHPWEARMVSRVLPAIGAATPAGSRSAPEDLLSSLPMVAFRPE